MGYTHYFKRAPELDRKGFAQAAEDVQLICERLTFQGVRLAGPTGEGKPDIGNSTIAFNGAARCGHRYMPIGKPWPSDEAEGVQDADRPYDPQASPGTSGPYLSARACGGSCAGHLPEGSFVVDRVYLAADWERPEKEGYRCYCETDFKPYDLAVTAALVRLKENLGNEILISSDGGEKAFEDAKRLCRELFGWARRFELEPQDSEVV